MNKLTKAEIDFLKKDYGLEKVIQRSYERVEAIKDGKLIFIGFNPNDVRNMNPGMREAIASHAKA